MIALLEQPSELTVPWLSPPALTTPAALEQACAVYKPVDSPGVQPAISETGQSSERADHRPADCRVKIGLASVVLVAYPRQIFMRLAIFDGKPGITDLESNILDTLSILINFEICSGPVISG